MNAGGRHTADERMGDGPSSLRKDEMGVSSPLPCMRVDAHLAHPTGHHMGDPGERSHGLRNAATAQRSISGISLSTLEKLLEAT